jgi:aspartyl/asparaginyl beta-hydroxylase (cupin superfamily)
LTNPDDDKPFDETAVTRPRRRCYFCEAEKSDEWRFAERLNAFICRDCLKKIEAAIPSDQEDRSKRSEGKRR